ncbi:MAG: FtsX-like permease family protein [Acidimicrobiales bacterium]
MQPNRFGGIRVALRTLLRQRRRMLLSIIAVALGVGYLAGSLSLLQRVGAGLAAQAGADSERADLVIEGTIADDGPLQQVRKLVPDSIAETVRSIPGVAAVEPRLESNSTLIIGDNGRPVVRLGLTERPLGANYPTDPGLNPYRFVGSGRAPRTDSEVVIDRRSAAIAGVKVGQEVTITGKVDPKRFTVTGIVEMTTGDLPAGSSLALFETEAARPLFELGTDDNAIAIRLARGADRDAVAAKIRAVVYSGAEVSTGAEYADHRQASLEKSFTLIRALLVGFAGLALVVGAFTVANSMALLFDHRRRGFAMLRLMGASPSQLVGAATAEALIGGVIAGIVGLGLGLGVGAAIERLIQSMGTPLPVAGSPLTWWIPVVAVLVGAAVTMITALSPARHASRTPPVHAVTGADDRPTGVSPAVVAARWIATVVVLGGGAAIAGQLLGGGSVALVAGAAGAAVALVLIVLPRLLSGVVGMATSVLLGQSVALRRMSTLRSRQARTRAASTTAALLLAAAVVSGLTVLSSSFLESVEGQVTASIKADLVVDSATFTKGGLSAALIPELRRQPGVAAVSGWRPGAVYVGAPLWRAGGLDGASMFKVLNLDVEGTTPSSFGVNDVVVSKTLADDQHLKVGQQVPVGFQNGIVMHATVRAIFRSQLNVLLGDVLIDSTVMATNLPQSVDVLAFVDLTKNAPATARRDITALSARYGGANVLKPSQLVSKRAELLRGFGRVIQWMLAFSIILALIGVANTLQLGVNERRRELGLIRAVGATRAQVLRLVMAEATALSLVGTLFGLVIGVGAAYATVAALSDFGLDRFVAPLGTLVGIVVIAIGLGLVGAIVPALRAADIPLLDAIADGGDEQRRPRRLRHAPPAASDGDRPQPTANVDQSVTARSRQAPTPVTEVHMALRCYNCGHEPGDGDTCVVCGATQAATPVGMFTLRQDAPVDAGQPPAYNPAGSTPPISVSFGADIVDAAVVEDGVVVETGPNGESAESAPTGDHASEQPMWSATDTGPAAATPPPYVATEAGTDDIGATPPPPPSYGVEAQAETSGQSLGSIFDGRPTPSEAHDPLRSPFGQFATERADEPAPRLPDPTTVPRHGIFTPGSTEPEDDRPVDDGATAAPSGPVPTPPAYAQQIANPVNGAAAPAPVTSAASDATPTVASAGSTLPDSHGLAASVSRLSDASQQQGLVPFSIAGALLGPDERVLATVAGSSLGMDTVVVVTQIRAIIVSDRRYVPDVEIFELGPTLTVHGRHANGLASLTFGDGDRLVTVDQIVDVGLAVELANTARNRTAAAEF